MLTLKISVPTLTLWLLFCLPTQAQTAEFWSASEFLLSMHQEEHELSLESLIPDRFRVYTQLNSGQRAEGLYQLLWRVGPVWNPTPFLSYSMHLTNASFLGREERFGREVRFEAEPLLKGSFLPGFNWSNRHRLEYRLRNNGNSWRYRTRAGLDYEIPDWPVTAFLTSEYFFETTHNGFNQNRNTLGLSFKINQSVRLNLSYMLRFEQSDRWYTTHTGYLTLAYSSQEDGIFRQQAN